LLRSRHLRTDANRLSQKDAPVACSCTPHPILVRSRTGAGMAVSLHASSFSSSDAVIIPHMGVRISCDMLAKKSAFALAAASARSFSPSASRCPDSSSDKRRFRSYPVVQNAQITTLAFSPKPRQTTNKGGHRRGKMEGMTAAPRACIP
jgi:hypothetical protein